MLIFENTAELQKYLKSERHQQRSIGFVPTMGALHQGHLSLIEKAKENNDIVVCSIFVNPTQFNNTQDLAKYPRTISQDQELLAKQGCDVLFLPEKKTMYPNPTTTTFSFGNLENTMEGAHRAGHFNGVALIVSKLFHLVQPNQAYFGQKDLQQYLIIRQFSQDLFFNTEVICCPIVREKDGLAMSSRNLRLTPSERTIAPKIHEALQLAKQSLLAGKSVHNTKNTIQNFFTDLKVLDLEYFEIVKSITLEPIDYVDDSFQISLCIAAFLGEVRLIDNVFLYNHKGVF
ncbi:pantoate--beta-alanine ligase [marine bacterium AO1-C]|nr:pantoate--beta-alanine ligase [marine bacterium AO1-C]